MAGAVWIVARNKWASLYASGGASARYSSKVSAYIWYSLICCGVASVSFALSVLAPSVF